MKSILLFRLLLFSVICLLSSTALKAQTREAIDVQIWPRGEVTLTSGEVLKGVVTYYRSQDIITVSLADNTLSSLSPVNVAKFEVSNAYSNRRHLFKSIYWDQGDEHTDFKKPTFFEQIMEGNITLLMRESYNKRIVDSHLASMMENRTTDPLGYPIQGIYYDQIKPLFYVMNPAGEIKVIQQTRKDFLLYCGKKAPVIKSFVRKNRLNFDQPSDFIAIVNYYNTL
ncbi:hypothetical protein JAO76_10660 [Pontibacter sp. BT310]|uniref:DUF3108 domain-containing protein n=1 Tax=Pontibacter populi TaxID=890055 RepID=A0ABS6XE80_9BACT|nr:MULTISPECIES: hypothetical protein [Pontibacter]MBJ6118656.1 hypothetical protein [Pontibacter sp. BT310]MBR0571085.1 hypothetical protein [Microvirga sp. STS03]MBW3365510.1 hypothetical protein [Pontibacter populi]